MWPKRAMAQVVFSCSTFGERPIFQAFEPEKAEHHSKENVLHIASPPGTRKHMGSKQKWVSKSLGNHCSRCHILMLMKSTTQFLVTYRHSLYMVLRPKVLYNKSTEETDDTEENAALTRSEDMFSRSRKYSQENRVQKVADLRKSEKTGKQTARIRQCMVSIKGCYSTGAYFEGIMFIVKTP